MERMKQIITAIRTLRAESNVSPSKKVEVYFAKGSAQDHQSILEFSSFIQSLARIEKWQFVDVSPANCSSAVSESLNLFIS